MQVSNLILGYYAAAAKAHNRNAISHAPSHQPQEKRDDLLNPKDSIMFSKAALEAAANPESAVEAENSGSHFNNEQFKNRENGLSSSSEQANAAFGQEQSGEMKARINWLTSRLSQLMNSSLPENVKAAKAGSLYGQISQLSARLVRMDV